MGSDSFLGAGARGAHFMTGRIFKCVCDKLYYRINSKFPCVNDISAISKPIDTILPSLERVFRGESIDEISFQVIMIFDCVNACRLSKNTVSEKNEFLLRSAK